MNKLLQTAAITCLMAGSAIAQTTLAPAAGEMFRLQSEPTDLPASRLIGMRVYAGPTGTDVTSVPGVPADWEDIGEINDLVVSRDGQVSAVLVDIGGFLGIGERQVAVQMPALRIVGDDATADSPDDFFLVLGADRAMLEAAPGYGPAMEGAEAAATPAPDAGAPAADSVAGNGMVLPDGYAAYPRAELTAERVTGAEVYDPSGTRMGEVSDLVLDGAGTISHVVMDIGGFLGIGEKRVALSLDEVQVTRSSDGDVVRVFVPYDEERLKALETYQD